MMTMKEAIALFNALYYDHGCESATLDVDAGGMITVMAHATLDDTVSARLREQE